MQRHSLPPSLSPAWSVAWQQTGRLCSRVLLLLALFVGKLAPLTGGEVQLQLLRNEETFLNQVLVPDIFFDLAPSGGDVFRGLSQVPPFGDSYQVSILDDLLPEAPRMAPVTLWRSSEQHWLPKDKRFKLPSSGRRLRINIGLRIADPVELLLQLAEDPALFIVQCVADATSAYELHYLLKSPTLDDAIASRLIALPVAIAREPSLSWSFRSMLKAETSQRCRGCTLPSDYPEAAINMGQCREEAHEPALRELVSAVSLDALVNLFLLGPVEDDQDLKVHLQLEANDALPDVLDSLHSLPFNFLHSIVKLEVLFPEEEQLDSEWRYDIFRRVRLLGLEPDWHLQDEDHDLRFTCRIALGNEECVFRRVSGDEDEVVFRLVSALMRSPEEFVHLEMSSHRTVSRQFAILQRRYLEAHFVSGGLPMDGMQAWMNMDELRDMGSMIMMMWDVPGSEKELLDDSLAIAMQIAYTLASMDSWEALYGTGAALSVFTLIVETLCRIAPDCCQPAADFKGLHGFRPGIFVEDEQIRARQQLSCRSLSECHGQFRHLAPNVHTFLQRPEEMVAIFRTAQFLSAPPCMPPNWNLEMVHDPGRPFPSLSVGSNWILTVLAADSTTCGLELSAVALYGDLDGQEVQIYRSRLNNINGNPRELDSVDLRLPTEGEDWIFDCVFVVPGSARPIRTLAETKSFAMMQETQGRYSAPVLTIRCETPPEFLSGGMGTPQMVRLERSARSSPAAPWIALDVPLRPSSKPHVRTAMCTQQTWDASFLESRIPGHLDLWFSYHLEVLGIDQIYLYDLDGSFADLEVVAYWRAAGRIIYEDAFGEIQPLKRVFEDLGLNTGSAHLTQTLVQHHCLQQAKTNADWIVSVSHGWDMMLFSPTQTLNELLDSLPEDALTFIPAVRYGTKEETPAGNTGGNVFSRFPHRNDLNLPMDTMGIPEERILIGSPRLLDGLLLSDAVTRLGSQLYSSLRQGLGFSERAQWNPHIVDPVLWRANHYVELLGRKLVYLRETIFPELRAFSEFDEAAYALGEWFNGLMKTSID